jgi:uncharacterized protein (TIGR00269 family)
MADCGKCGMPAVTYLRHAGRHLCSEHFIELTEKRVQKAIRQQANLSGGAIIAMACSGGKDSMTCLEILRKTLQPRRDSRIVVITVDEGIAGYRGSSINIARDYCQEHDLQWIMTSIEEEQGVTMDAVAAGGMSETPCAYCGVWRRWSMNKAAREAGARYLATGLNLDDTAQNVLMNVCRGDVERLARLGPHTREQLGLVPRIQPLRWIPEVESYLYAHLSGLPIHNAECPHLGRAQRGRYRKVLHELQEDEPGVAHALVRSLERMRPALETQYAPIELAPCPVCGEPSPGGGTCKACSFKKAFER